VNRRYEVADALVLLQCTAMYPLEDDAANLRAMDALREATGAEVGYSDHTRGSLALLVAAARGARVLEFHFTDTRDGRTFRDHQVSLTAAEVGDLKRQLERLPALLGDGVKRLMPCEIETGHVTSFRRAVYSRRPLKAGEPIEESDLVVLRPNHGVDARRFRQAVGRRVRRDTAAFEALDLE
jgi:N-acetylneuraminate synthase/N,N'-diacetyllegionaminate synthase